jgi:hypothetical protein
MRIALAVLGLATCLSVVGATRAAPEWIRATIRVERGEDAAECSDEAGIRQAVESRLRRPVFVSEPDADVRVQTTLRRAAAGWTAELVLQTPQGQKLGTRQLSTEAPHCSALDDSVALALALMLDVPRDKVMSADRLAPVEQPHSPAASPPPSTPVQLPEDTPPRRLPWSVEGGLLAVLGIGVLPGAAPGVRVSAAVEPPVFWLTEVEWTWWPARDASDAGVGAGLGRQSFGLFVCPLLLDLERVRAHACLGQQVGWIRAEGHGFDENRDRARTTYGLGVRARGSIQLVGPLTFRAGLEVEAPLVRDRFVFTEGDGTQERLYRLPLASLTGELGLGLRL